MISPAHPARLFSFWLCDSQVRAGALKGMSAGPPARCGSSVWAALPSRGMEEPERLLANLTVARAALPLVTLGTDVPDYPPAQ